MNMTADTRSSAYVRRLRVGDIIHDVDGDFLVTRAPEINGGSVRVYLAPINTEKRRYSRAFNYHLNARVKVNNNNR